MNENTVSADNQDKDLQFLPVLLEWKDTVRTRQLMKKVVWSWVGFAMVITLISADYFTDTVNVFSQYYFLTILAAVVAAGLAFYAARCKNLIGLHLQDKMRENLMKNVETKYGTDEMDYAGQIIIHAVGDDVYEYAYNVDEETGEPELFFTVKRTVAQIQQRFEREKREAELKKIKVKKKKRKSKSKS